jgi:hypothetical protein
MLEPDGVMGRRAGGNQGPPCPQCGQANLLRQFPPATLDAPTDADEDLFLPPDPTWYRCPVCRAEFARF